MAGSSSEALTTHRPTRSAIALTIAGQQVPLSYVHNARARRYVLRVRHDGQVRVTIPRGGSMAFATEFALKNGSWIEQQLEKRQQQSERSRAWTAGSVILFRGEEVLLQLEQREGIAIVRFADQEITVRGQSADLRPMVEAHLWALADKELPVRVVQIGSVVGASPRRVVVRNQRSRWGSCSARGTISLNWRLVQAPPEVRDYLIVHELMHLRQMNHSPRFWDLVAAACPDYQRRERWLDDHATLLR